MKKLVITVLTAAAVMGCAAFAAEAHCGGRGYRQQGVCQYPECPVNNGVCQYSECPVDNGECPNSYYCPNREYAYGGGHHGYRHH